MAKITVNIALDQSTNPATIVLDWNELTDTGTINDLGPDDIPDIIIEDADNGPVLQFVPKKIRNLQWEVTFAPEPGNRDMGVQSPFAQEVFQSDEDSGHSAGVNPDLPTDSTEEGAISADIDDAWATQVPQNESWVFSFTVTFMNNNAAPITRRLRAKRL